MPTPSRVVAWPVFFELDEPCVFVSVKLRVLCGEGFENLTTENTQFHGGTTTEETAQRTAL